MCGIQPDAKKKNILKSFKISSFYVPHWVAVFNRHVVAVVVVVVGNKNLCCLKACSSFQVFVFELHYLLDIKRFVKENFTMKPVMFILFVLIKFTVRVRYTVILLLYFLRTIYIIANYFCKWKKQNITSELQIKWKTGCINLFNVSI